MSSFFSIHEGSFDAPAQERKTVRLGPATLGSATATFDGLRPDTRYYYKVWPSPARLLELADLSVRDLHFRTLPEPGQSGQLDFMLLTCHDPTQCENDGEQGFRVWRTLKQVVRENNVRFAIMAGDQIYGDHVQEEVLAEHSTRRRLELYLGVYQKLWRHAHYRRLLCQLPAYLVWDDHDITDGWGSRSDSFTGAHSSQLRPEWQRLFEAARNCFEHLQMARNPAPLRPQKGAAFDFCFKAMRDWVKDHRDELEVLFFVSPVVFTHAWPHVTESMRSADPLLTALARLLSRAPGVGSLRWLDRFIHRNIKDVASLRDDLEDAWASDSNRAQAEELLDSLFGLQNPSHGQLARGFKAHLLAPGRAISGKSLKCSRGYFWQLFRASQPPPFA